MVKRAEASGGLDEFEGIVEKAEFESAFGDRRQYHLTIDATNVEVGGATGKLHEWVPMSATCTEDIVPPQSVMDRYLQQLEICIKDVQKAETLADAFKLVVGKKFKWKKMKLGRDFEGNKAKDYFVPVALIE